MFKESWISAGWCDTVLGKDNLFTKYVTEEPLRAINDREFIDKPEREKQGLLPSCPLPPWIWYWLIYKFSFSMFWMLTNGKHLFVKSINRCSEADNFTV